MYSDFKAQANEYLNQAIKADNETNYAKAFPLYMNALEYFKTHLKYEKDPEVRKSIELKFEKYLHRAEEIRAILDSHPKPAIRAFDDLVVIKSKKQAFEVADQAVEEDNAGNYPKALSLYVSVLEYLKEYCKHEKDPKIRDTVMQKFDVYDRRAREIQVIINLGGEKINSSDDGTSSSCFNFVKFRNDAIEYVKEAIKEDNSGNYAKAFPLYMNSLEYFRSYLKYEKDFKIREAITVKFNEYLRRAEQIRAVLDKGGGASRSEDGGHGEDHQAGHPTS